MKRLSKETVEDYRRIYKVTYGMEISYEEAERQGLQLLRLFKVIYKPIETAQLERDKNDRG